MADKQAGDLFVEITSSTSGVSRTLGTLVTKLDKLKGIISGINTANFSLQFTQLSNSLKSITTQDLKNITSLGTRVKSLNKRMSELDWSVIQKGFDNLTVAITPFINKVTSAETSLRALNEILTKVSNKKLKNLGGFDISSKSQTTSSRSGAFGFLNVARWGAILYSARRVGRVVADIAQSGADYTETLNLWETAMGTNVTLATEFVKKMNEAYGISEKTLMNAQATFKNMLGGLGNISDQMAYALSEGITQMAVDYASLYNQTFEQAFTKFQAALAGQVRPIRSVSGFDITEQTLFALYQELGGTKTMRQLNRTEKQLLSILAIFEQMSATGAVGDLNKTMNSFANQSRVMAENWKQVQSYAGILVTHTIQESGLLTYVNAILIFIGDTLKAVAESIGAIQRFADPFQATTEGALGASDAIDEVQGKLLDFDKFRSLSGAEQNVLGLDERLLQAFSNFDSILANAKNEARDLAESWKIASGLFDESGIFNKDRWDEIITSIKLVTVGILGILAFGLTKKIIGLSIALSTKLVSGIKSVITFLNAFAVSTNSLNLAMSVTVGLVSFLLADMLLKNLGEDARKSVSGIMAMVGALTSLAVTLLAVNGLVKGAWVLPVILAGVGVSIAGLKGMLSVSDFANGGLPDKGTLFRAGEAGAEIVYNTPSGQSGVVNVQQIKSAMYQALVEYGESHRSAEGDTVIKIGEEEVFRATRKSAKKQGLDFAKV